MAQSSFQQSITNITNARDVFFQQAKATGLRKRNSLFNRPESRDASNDERGAAPAMSNRSVSAPQDLPQTPKRPEKVERRSTEPEKRHSLFSRRKSAKKGKTPIASPESSFDESEEVPVLGLDVLYPREVFRTEDEYYRYLRKQTISPPFNFQHNIHTRHKHLPDLATVDEKDLPREFWAASAYQTPLRQLNGIAAEELTLKLASMGVTRGAPSSRPTSPAPTSPALSGHFSDNETRSSYSKRRPTWEGRRGPESPRLSDVGNYVRNLPQRQSSLGSQRPTPVHRESTSSRTSVDSCQSLPIASQFLGQATDFPSISSALAAVPETTEQATQAHRTPEQLKYRSQQPLPALPTRLKSQKSKAAARESLTSLHPSTGVTSAPQSRPSSQSVRLAPPAAISSPDLRRPKMESRSSWEDDVDFCYEQEAEATCDFDWEAAERRSMSMSASRPTSSNFPGTPNHRDSLPIQRPSPSIGHHGFRQARHDSRLYLPVDGTSSPANRSLSQLVSSPPETKPVYSPGSVDLPPLEAIGADSLSDPESNRSAKWSHRESSSYGSRESIVRSTAALEEARHASLSSMASVPDLYHSSRSSASAPRLDQRPLTTAGLERPASGAQVEIMRKPSTQSNRAILQAGRVSQRVRPPTPSRFSKLLAPQQGMKGDVPKEEDAETNWI